MYRLIFLISLAGCLGTEADTDTGEPDIWDTFESVCSPGLPTCEIGYSTCVETGPPYRTRAEFDDGHVIDCEDAGGCSDESADIRAYCRE